MGQLVRPKASTLRFSMCVGVCVVALMSNPSLAQNQDTLWLKVVTKMKANQQMVPRDVELTMYVTKDEQQSQINIQKRITSWNQHGAVYTNLKTTVVPASPEPKKEMKPFDMKSVMNGISGEIFKPDANVKRTDDVILGGKKWSLFELKEGGLKKTSMKIWVHPETTQIYQQEIEAYIPMGFDGKMQTFYDLEDEGNNLPVMSKSSGVVLIPFRKMTLSITESYKNWISRPAN